MKLKTLMEKHGVSQTALARILGRDKAVVTNLYQGRRQLKADEAMRIARHLGVPVAEVLGAEAAAGLAEPSLIPFHHEPAKARACPHVVRRDGKYYYEEPSQVSGKAYALEVRDDSLNLAGFLPGDIVFSELDRRVKKGDVAVTQHYEKQDAQTLLRIYEPPYLRPHSTSAAFKPLHLEEDDVRVVSPVIRLVRWF